MCLKFKAKHRKKFFIFLILLFFILLSVVFLYYKIEKDTHTLVVNKINLTYPNLPKDLENYKIAFVTDTHLGPATNIKFYNQIIETLNNQDIDLLLLGGDYIWLKECVVFRYQRNKLYNNLSDRINIKNIYKDTIDSFSKVKTKDGIIAIYGNHDNWVKPNVLKKLSKNSKIKLVGRKNIFIKKNNSILSIFTFNDFWKTIPRIKDSKTKLNENEFRILLAHNPDSISYINRHYQLKYNLSLSGHTHGGQIALPLIPKASNTYYKEFISGLTNTGENSYHYTSNGIGYTSMPFRFNVKPEIAILTLVKR